MTFLSKSEKETQKVAGDLALKIMKSSTSPTSSLPPSLKLRRSRKLRSSRRLRRASVIVLEGELGAGKTVFVRGFAKALGIKAKIKSPTFVLMKKYPIRASGYSLTASRYLYHLDCYRVRDHRDLTTLDLRTIFNTPGNIVLIEWPERVSKILPKKLTKVHIDHISENKRKISLGRT